MRKTKRHISIPLNKIALELIDIRKVGKSMMVFDLVPNEIVNLNNDDISKRIESRNAYFNKRLKLLVKKAGIEKSISFHCSRITFCSLAISLGISRLMITEIAGLTLKVLENHYAKYFDDNKAKAVNLFDTL